MVEMPARIWAQIKICKDHFLTLLVPTRPSKETLKDHRPHIGAAEKLVSLLTSPRRLRVQTENSPCLGGEVPSHSGLGILSSEIEDVFSQTIVGGGGQQRCEYGVATLHRVSTSD
jgi:hypothetical protein